MEKDNIQNLLLNIGREIVREKGTEALTVRKLSEASGCSVGAIYNQFSNMDNFILIQNYMTLDELSKQLSKVAKNANTYVYLNDLLQEFIDFVLENKNLWFLLYNFHLRQDDRVYSFVYLRKVTEIINYVKLSLEKIVPRMERPERLLASQVLWLSIFAVSSFIAKNMLNDLSKINKKSMCQILLNTYIAGLTVLEIK